MPGKRKAVPNGDETLSLFDSAQGVANKRKINRPFGVPGLRIDTSAFTAAGWEDAFYPAGMRPPDCLASYAIKFDTVEIDSTFYRVPSASTIKSWHEKTPSGFIFVGP